MFECITCTDEVGKELKKLSVDALINLAQTNKQFRERAELEIFRRRLGELTRIRIEVEAGKRRAALVASLKSHDSIKEGRE